MEVNFSEITFLYGAQNINMDLYLDIKEYYCKLSYKVKLNTLLILGPHLSSCKSTL